jgi:hypothetical protein
LHHLFHLHFFLLHVQDDRNKKNALDGRNAPVSQNLSEQDDLDEKNLHVLDGQVLKNPSVLDAPI